MAEEVRNTDPPRRQTAKKHLGDCDAVAKYHKPPELYDSTLKDLSSYLKLTASKLIQLAASSEQFRKLLLDDLCSLNTRFLEKFKSNKLVELNNRAKVKDAPYRLLRSAKVVDKLSDEDLFKFLYCHDPNFEEENILKLLSESKDDDRSNPTALNNRMTPDMWLNFFVTAKLPIHGIENKLIIEKLSINQILELFSHTIETTSDLSLSFIYLKKSLDIFLNKVNSLDDSNLTLLKEKNLHNRNFLRLLLQLLDLSKERFLEIYGEKYEIPEDMVEQAKSVYDKLIKKINSRWPNDYKCGQKHEDKESPRAKIPIEESDSKSIGERKPSAKKKFEQKELPCIKNSCHNVNDNRNHSADLFVNNYKPKYSNKWYCLSIVIAAVGLVLSAAAILSGIGIIPVSILATYLFASFGGPMFVVGVIGTTVIYCKNKKYNKLPQNPVPADQTETSVDSEKNHGEPECTNRTTVTFTSNPSKNPAAFSYSGAPEKEGSAKKQFLMNEACRM